MSDPQPPLPRALVFWAGVTCGVLATLALQIQLNQRGIELDAIWREFAAGRGMPLRLALVWWVIAGTAFLVAAATAAALNRWPPPWHSWTAVRRIVALAIVIGLGEIARRAGLPEHGNSGLYVASSLTAAGVATLMAMFGAFFAVRG